MSEQGDSNKHRYVIVAQSTALRNHLRRIAATPLIHINRSVMILEPPSDATVRAKTLVRIGSLDSSRYPFNISLHSQMEEKNLGATSSSDIKLVKETQPEEAPKKKKKGPKGPNPLSVKKKKVPPQQPVRSEPPKKKVERRSDTKPQKKEDKADLGKRKRDDADGEDEPERHVQTTGAEGEQVESSARKRRRRRKAMTSAAAEVGSGEVDDDNS